MSEKSTMAFTLQELQYLDAVVTEGSFQAAADRLHRSHPAVHSAIRKLEHNLGVALLDRSAYRVKLTAAGHAFLRQAKDLLACADHLERLSDQLAQGEETDLRIVIGDLTPVAPVLRHLKAFFARYPHTRLHLHFEALSGPWQRLLGGEADLIVHHVEKSDQRFEWLHLHAVTLVPVAAKGYLSMPVTRQLTPAHLAPYVQVVIRDSAEGEGRDYFLVQGARSWTVADQQTKKELIVHGMGWGHMPLHLIDKELKSGKLQSLEGRHFKRSRLDIVAARLRGQPVGPVAQALWDSLATLA
jgi:DNA-binding transcriptional LysR family regulator